MKRMASRLAVAESRAKQGETKDFARIFYDAFAAKHPTKSMVPWAELHPDIQKCFLAGTAAILEILDA